MSCQWIEKGNPLKYEYPILNLFKYFVSTTNSQCKEKELKTKHRIRVVEHKH